MELVAKKQAHVPPTNPIYFDPVDNDCIPNEWKVLRDEVEAFSIPGLVLAGGSILPYYNKEYTRDFKVRDLDVFFLKTPYVFDSQKELYDRLIDRLINVGYAEKDVSPSGLVRTYAKRGTSYSKAYPQIAHAMNFTLHPNSDGVWDTSVPEVQIICKTYDSIQDLFDNFDLGISQFAFDGTKIIKTRMAKQNLMYNKITCLNVHRPFNTLNRIVKYHDRGFEINAALGQYLYLFAGKVESYNGDLTACNALLEYVSLQCGDDQVIIPPTERKEEW